MTCFQVFSLNNDVIETIIVWEENICAILQSLILMIFSLLLISFMSKSRKRHAEIMTSVRPEDKWRKTNRTIAVLLAMILSSLLARVFKVVFEFFMIYFQDLDSTNVDILNHVAYLVFCLNSSLNVFFYMMSGEFRRTLRTMFSCSVLPGRSEGVLNRSTETV